MPQMVCNTAFVWVDLLLIRIESMMTSVGLYSAPRELLVAGLNQALEYIVYIISLYAHWIFFCLLLLFFNWTNFKGTQLDIINVLH